MMRTDWRISLPFAQDSDRSSHRACERGYRKLRIAFVGLRLSQIPSGTGAAHHDTPPPGVREFDFGNAGVALLENAIFCQQSLKVIADPQERIAERPDVVEKLPRQILMYAANPEIICMHASARGTLVKHH